MKKSRDKHHFEVVQAIVAIEFGSTDEAVLRYLNFFSQQLPVFAAYFVHVLPQVDFFGALNELEPRRLIEDDELQEEVISDLEQKVRKHFPARESLYVEFDVKEGDPLENILNESQETKADLVVIGQKSGTRRHGIMARKLARKSEVNAMVIPDQAAASLKHILVPVDFSEHSAQALKTAINIRKELKQDVRLTCLHVFERPDLVPYRLSRTPQEMAEILRKNREEAFNKFLDEYAGAGRSMVEMAMVDKDLPGIARYIADYAKSNEVDFVVIGAKGHSNVERLLLGSVTENLLSRTEETPILIIK